MSVPATRPEADRLLPLVYRELRALAARYLRSEQAGSTWEPTSLVHEAYLRLIENERIDWKGKTQFLAMAATQMRRILVDHARARAAKKRGGRGRPITLTETLLSTEIAFNMGVSERTVKEDSRIARAWLMKELAGSEP